MMSTGERIFRGVTTLTIGAMGPAFYLVTPPGEARTTMCSLAFFAILMMCFIFAVQDPPQD